MIVLMPWQQQGASCSAQLALSHVFLLPTVLRAKGKSLISPSGTPLSVYIASVKTQPLLPLETMG